jgi:hypothetical protein
MTDIIKETLKKTLTELSEEIQRQEVLRDKELVEEANSITSNLDDLFEDFTIKVSSTDIDFKLTTDSWFNFRISRSTKYTEAGHTFTKAGIESSSMSNKDEKELKKMICLGILAKECLNNTSYWGDLISLMDECNRLHKVNIGPLYNQLYQVEDEIKKINNKEANDAFQTIFDSGTFKLKKNITYCYGQSRWDNVSSDHWFWEANGTGKTYNVSYISSRRTNPNYDEEGRMIEGIFELIKCNINKRIKKADIVSFVHQNMSSIEQKVSN